MNAAPKTTLADYYTSIDQVTDRFVDIISDMNTSFRLGLRETAIPGYAESFAYAAWTQHNGAILKAAQVFTLGAKITRVTETLGDIGVTHREIFDLFVAKKALSRQKSETTVRKFRTLIDLVLQLKDPLVPFEQRLSIRTPRDAFRYFVHSAGSARIMSAPETIANYRRYAELVRTDKLQHTSFNTRSGTNRAILVMPIDELEKRLADYDRRVAWSAAAKAANTAVVTPAPQRPTAPDIHTPEGRQAAAAQFLARRAAKTLSQR